MKTNSPGSLTGGKAPIRTNGRAASSLAGRARDGLVALEFEAAAFCARYGTSCALVLLLLCPGGALLVVAEADGVGHRGRRERRPRRGGVMQAAREGRRGRDGGSTRTGVSEGRRRAVGRMDDSLPRDGRRRSYRGVPVTLAFHARPSLALPPAAPPSFASAAIAAFSPRLSTHLLCLLSALLRTDTRVAICNHPLQPETHAESFARAL